MASTTPDSLPDIGAIPKMKVADLKKELKARGLSAVGSKNELVERLQAAASSQTVHDLLSEDGNPEAEIPDEDDILGGEEEGGEFDEDDELVEEAGLAQDGKPKPAEIAPAKTTIKRPAPLATETSQVAQPKKRILVRPSSVSSTGKENGTQEKEAKPDENTDNTVKNGNKILKLSGVSVKERLELRAQKFGIPLSTSAKKEARAQRFGTTTSNTTAARTKIAISTKPTPEVLKKRAERFGMNVSTALSNQVQLSEKIKKRQERFGTVTTIMTEADRKKLRAERFKI